MKNRWLKSYPKNVKHTMDFPNLSIVDFLRKAADESSNQIALVFNTKKWTYKELENNVSKIANGLRQKGVKKGTRVALMMNNCPDFIFAYFAVLYCGGIVVLNNPMYKERELFYQIQDSEAEYLIIEAKILKRLDNINNLNQLKEIIISRTVEKMVGYDTLFNMLCKESATFEPVLIEPRNDLAVLQYTGGTTGVPKGAMLSHFNLLANVMQTNEFLGVNCKVGKEKILNVLPLFHVYGMTVSMNLSIFLQSTLYLEERLNTVRLLSIIEDEQITMFPGTPTIYVSVNSDEIIGNFRLSSIHTCISGSAPLPIEVKNKFESLAGATIVDAYGLSEASPVTHSNPVNGVQKLGSMGIPMPNTECKIVDLHEGKEVLPVNTPGELIVKGPQVMMGYWNRQEDTDRALREGWLYTGDIAYMDEDGYFFIVGRSKDVIISSGYNVYPREIEEIIFEHPAVHEVVVAGVPHSYRGEVIKAFVVLKRTDDQSILVDELMNYCKSKLAAYKVPHSIEVMKELPKTTVGKVLRRKLIEDELMKQKE